MIRLLIVQFMLAAAGAAGAQSAFPAPLPGQTAPNVGAAPFRFNPLPWGGWSEACMTGFIPLREEAEKRGKLIGEASARHAVPVEACKLVGAYAQAAVKMIKYVETNAQQCRMAPQFVEQMRNWHKSTTELENKVCGAAQGNQGPPVRFNDFGDPAFQSQ